jgi:hypothetical protein
MNQNNGGFPPLFLKKDTKNLKKSDQKELKSQFFSETDRKNINIREILSNQESGLNLNQIITNNEIKEIDNF